MTSSATFWILMFLAGGILFVLPVIIGLIRGVDDMGLVFYLNVLGLLSLSIGWFAAMLVACFDPKRARARRAPVKAYSPPPPPSALPTPFQGTPFESVAHYRHWAEQHSGAAPSQD
jgi:hypothetical protein